jgi:acetolactate synthase-1/2/3 large subunit
LAIASDHPMSVGTALEPWLSEADVILVLDCLAPWSPAIHKLAPGCKVIQAGPDPLYSRFPVRNFQADVSLTGETADIVLGLARAMKPHFAARADACAARRSEVAAKAADIRTDVLRAAERGGAGEQMTKAWVSLCLSRAIQGLDATVLSELGCPLDPLTLRTAGSWYQEPHSGGLGWSFPCALGMQLAAPDRVVIATMGDGSYMFANPVACHQIAEALGLPVLVLVLNNREWGAVRQSVLGTYPDGYAARTNQMPLVSLDPTPDFTLVARASRAWTARVEAAKDLPGALAAAIEHVRTKRTQALVEILVAP